MNTITQIIVAAAIAAMSTSTVQAQDAETNSVTVAYKDLDLNTQVGQDHLVSRVRSAATQACGGESDVRDLSGKRIFKACLDAATKEALSTITAKRNPALAATGER